MKNLVRFFALALVATGAAASLHASNNTTATTVSGKVSAPPVALCPPNDPNACGMGQLGR